MQTVTYQPVAKICATLFAALSLILLFIPDLIFWLFQLADSLATTAMARRAGILFLGLFLIMFLTRDHARNPTRRSVQAAGAVMLGAMACLGALEFLRGTIGPGVWLAIVVELALASALIAAR